MVYFTPAMVKVLREAMDISQEDLAREIGTGVRSVARWESKDTPKKIQRGPREKLIKLWKKYGVEKP